MTILANDNIDDHARQRGVRRVYLQTVEALVAQLVAAGHTVRVLDNLSSGRAENVPAGVELRVAEITDREAEHRHSRKTLVHKAVMPAQLVAPNSLPD